MDIPSISVDVATSGTGWLHIVDKLTRDGFMHLCLGARPSGRVLDVPLRRLGEALSSFRTRFLLSRRFVTITQSWTIDIICLGTEKLIPLNQLPSLQLLVLSGHVPVRRPRLFRFARCLRHLRSSHLKTVGFDLGIDDLENGEAERILPALDLFFASQGDNHTSDHFEFSSLRNVVVNIFLSVSIDSKESEDTESRRFSVHQSLKEQVEKCMPCCHESGLLLVEVLSGDAQKSLLRHDIKSYYDKILRCRNK